MRELLRRLGYLLRGSRFHEELDEEIQFHIETRADEIEQTGVSRVEALRQARREFGHDLRAKEEARAAWRIGWLEDLVSDLRYAARAFRASPGFTAVAVLSLALGIGANTAIFSLVDTVMLRSLPVKHPEQLHTFSWVGRWRPESMWGRYVPAPGGESSSASFSYAVFQELKTRNQSFEEMFAAAPAQVNAVLDGHAFHIWGELVSGDYFRCLGVNAMLGRTLTPADDAKPGTSPLVVISHRFWRDHFNASGSVVGANITLNGMPYTVIGVMGPDFHGLETVGGFGLWLPLSMQEQAFPNSRLLSNPNTWWVRIIGRLKPAASAQRAQAELDAILGQTVTSQGLLSSRRPTPPHMLMTSASKGLTELRRQYSEPLIVLMIVVALVLLIACANLANLLLARATARSHEIGVRLALGASRSRLIRQLLTESLLLSGTGAMLGLVFARWTLIILPWMVTGGWEPPEMEFGLDARVLGFALVVSMLTGVAFGLAPALRATRVEANPLLKGAVTSLQSRRSPGRPLIVFQVALSLFLLIGAGLFVRTLISLKALDPGFRADRLLLFQLDPSLNGYSDARLRDFFYEVQHRVEAIPGVRSATISGEPLIGGGSSSTNFSILGYTPDQGKRLETNTHNVAPRYFETMGIPILVGRAISERDRATTPKVAVINETISREYFPGQNPVGRRMGFGGPKYAGEMEIVGVAQDAKYEDLRKAPPPTVYVPYLQQGLYRATFALRTTVDPKSIIVAARQAVESLDRTIPVSDFRTEEEQIDQSLSKERLFAKLCGFFSLTALLLTAIGVYGVLSYSVARRTKEIGIRMAIGAERRNVIWLVMQESIWLTLAGVAIGVAAALATSNLLTKLLYGLKPNDPLTIAAAALFLILVAGLAAYLPGRRASRIDPLQALRHE